MNSFRIAGINGIHTVRQYGIVLTGTQIMRILWPVGAVYQMQVDVLECNIRNIAGIISVDQNPVFTGTMDILESYIADMTDIFVIAALDRRDGNGFCFAPPMRFGKQAGINIQIGKSNIFYKTIVPKLHGNTAVGVADTAIGNGNIPERSFTFCSEFDSGTGGHQGTVIYQDVLTGTILHGMCCVFEYNTVIGTFNVTIRDPDIFTVIGINTIAVGQTQVVQDTNAVDQNIFTAYHVCGPESTAGEGHMGESQMRDVL